MSSFMKRYRFCAVSSMKSWLVKIEPEVDKGWLQWMIGMNKQFAQFQHRWMIGKIKKNWKVHQKQFQMLATIDDEEILRSAWLPHGAQRGQSCKLYLATLCDNFNFGHEEVVNVLYTNYQRLGEYFMLTSDCRIFRARQEIFLMNSTSRCVLIVITEWE
jgi:hypothetical protein